MRYMYTILILGSMDEGLEFDKFVFSRDEMINYCEKMREKYGYDVRIEVRKDEYKICE